MINLIDNYLCKRTEKIGQIDIEKLKIKNFTNTLEILKRFTELIEFTYFASKNYLSRENKFVLSFVFFEFGINFSR